MEIISATTCLPSVVVDFMNYYPFFATIDQDHNPNFKYLQISLLQKGAIVVEEGPRTLEGLNEPPEHLPCD